MCEIINKCVVCNENLNGNRKKFCSNKCRQKFKYENNKEKLNANNYFRQVETGIKRKLYFVNLKGGGCKKCGYNKNLSVLEFHHRDESTKSFSLDSRRMSNTSMKILEIEVDKCDVLCANCHREHHNPETEMSEISEFGVYKPKTINHFKCVDCGCEIGKRAKRCVDCSKLNNRKIKKRPSKEILLEKLKNSSFVKVALEYSVSDNTIRNWLK